MLNISGFNRHWELHRDRLRSLWGIGRKLGGWLFALWCLVKKTATPSRLIFVLKTLLLALGYYASGIVGTLLALPPGYAAPIWPPTGIALSAALLIGWRALPGIFLGSFFVTSWVPIAPLAGPATQQSMEVATVVALGASLQALTGAFLVRRFVGFPTALTEPRDVMGFLLLAGPIGCLIAPTVRVAWLWVEGIIQAAQVPFNWWTWWVGEIVGAIVLTPLILIWTSEPREVWRRRRLSATAPLALVLVMITLFFLYATKWEYAAATSQFERRAQELAEAIEKDLKAQLEVLYSIQSFSIVSPEVTRRDFGEFVERFLRRHPGILALSWNPYVPERQRLIYEESGRLEGFAHFQITELSANGELIRAPGRVGYVPVSYIEPLVGNERALGYDVASDPIKREALTRARDSGKPMATGWINLVEGKKEHLAFLVFLPVYVGNAPAQSTKQRRNALLGYATAVYRISDIVTAALKPFTHEEVELTLVDPGTPLRDRVAYFYSAKQQMVIPFTTTSSSGPFTWSTTLDVAGRLWVLNFSSTPAFLAAERSLHSWATGAVGLLIAALLSGYLLFATGHAYETEKLVEELQIQTTELTKANKVKEEFLGVMSHELRTPLTVMTGYLELMKSGALGDVNPKQRQALDKIFDQTGDQLILINSILQATQMESARLDVDQHLVHLSNFLKTLKESYEYHRSTSIGLRWDYPADLPTIVTDRAKLKQILQNLVNNAVKFTEQGEVLISARHFPELKSVEFKVSDTGNGIQKDSLPFIFDKFWQADSSNLRLHGGVGLGLYVAKRFTQLLKGEISVESEPGKGTTFTVRIPAMDTSLPLRAGPSHDGSKDAKGVNYGHGFKKQVDRKRASKT